MSREERTKRHRSPSHVFSADDEGTDAALPSAVINNNAGGADATAKRRIRRRRNVRRSTSSSNNNTASCTTMSDMSTNSVEHNDSRDDTNSDSTQEEQSERRRRSAVQHMSLSDKELKKRKEAKKAKDAQKKKKKKRKKDPLLDGYELLNTLRGDVQQLVRDLVVPHHRRHNHRTIESALGKGDYDDDDGRADRVVHIDVGGERFQVLLSRLACANYKFYYPDSDGGGNNYDCCNTTIEDGLQQGNIRGLGDNLLYRAALDAAERSVAESARHTSDVVLETVAPMMMSMPYAALMESQTGSGDEGKAIYEEERAYGESSLVGDDFYLRSRRYWKRPSSTQHNSSTFQEHERHYQRRSNNHTGQHNRSDHGSDDDVDLLVVYVDRNPTVFRYLVNTLLRGYAPHTVPPWMLPTLRADCEVLGLLPAYQHRFEGKSTSSVSRIITPRFIGGGSLHNGTTLQLGSVVGRGMGLGGRLVGSGGGGGGGGGGGHDDHGHGVATLLTTPEDLMSLAMSMGVDAPSSSSTTFDRERESIHAARRREQVASLMPTTTTTADNDNHMHDENRSNIFISGGISAGGFNNSNNNFNSTTTLVLPFSNNRHSSRGRGNNNVDGHGGPLLDRNIRSSSIRDQYGSGELAAPSSSPSCVVGVATPFISSGVVEVVFLIESLGARAGGHATTATSGKKFGAGGLIGLGVIAPTVTDYSRPFNDADGCAVYMSNGVIQSNFVPKETTTAVAAVAAPTCAPPGIATSQVASIGTAQKRGAFARTATTSTTRRRYRSSISNTTSSSSDCISRSPCSLSDLSSNSDTDKASSNSGSDYGNDHLESSDLLDSSCTHSGTSDDNHCSDVSVIESRQYRQAEPVDKNRGGAHQHQPKHKPQYRVEDTNIPMEVGSMISVTLDYTACSTAQPDSFSTGKQNAKNGASHVYTSTDELGAAARRNSSGWEGSDEGGREATSAAAAACPVVGWKQIWPPVSITAATTTGSSSSHTSSTSPSLRHRHHRHSHHSSSSHIHSSLWMNFLEERRERRERSRELGPWHSDGAFECCDESNNVGDEQQKDETGEREGGVDVVDATPADNDHHRNRGGGQLKQHPPPSTSLSQRPQPSRQDAMFPLLRRVGMMDPASLSSPSGMSLQGGISLNPNMFDTHTNDLVDFLSDPSVHLGDLIAVMPPLRLLSCNPAFQSARMGPVLPFPATAEKIATSEKENARQRRGRVHGGRMYKGKETHRRHRVFHAEREERTPPAQERRGCAAAACGGEDGQVTTAMNDTPLAIAVFLTEGCRVRIVYP